MGRSHRFHWAPLAAGLLALTACATHPPTSAPTGSAIAPTSIETARAAVRRFFDRVYADQTTLHYSFESLVQSSVHVAGITEHGYFLCGTIDPAGKAEAYMGRQVFFAHFNPLLRDVVDNASVQPGLDSETGVLCHDAYGRAGVVLGAAIRPAA